MSVEERVKKIVCEQLGVGEDEVNTDSSFVDDLGADSLDTVELVMALEEEFDLEIADEEAVNYNIYKKGEQYQWHIDADRTKSSDIKLTALINVSDTSFSGGDFYLLNSNNPLPVPELNNSGSMIIFNSFTLHKINPIKKGIRKTITIFLRGPAFK